MLYSMKYGLITLFMEKFHKFNQCCKEFRVEAESEPADFYSRLFSFRRLLGRARFRKNYSV